MSVLAVFGAIKNLISPKNKGADISNNAFTIARLVYRMLKRL